MDLRFLLDAWKIAGSSLLGELSDRTGGEGTGFLDLAELALAWVVVLTQLLVLWGIARWL